MQHMASRVQVPDQSSEMVNHNDDRMERVTEFYRYYSKKRAAHQHMQLSMLEVPALEGLKNLTEIGPYLGYATGLFMAAGFNLRTIDFYPNAFSSLKTEYISRNAAEVTTQDLAGSDVIVCCETLEHLPWDIATRQIKVFRQSGAKYFLISVPCSSWYFNLDIIATLTELSSKLSIKAPKPFKTFPEEPGFGHKWELGYKGYPVSRLKNALTDAGWNIVKCRYEVKNRAVFFLCKA